MGWLLPDRLGLRTQGAVCRAAQIHIPKVIQAGCRWNCQLQLSSAAIHHVPRRNCGVALNCRRLLSCASVPYRQNDHGLQSTPVARMDIVSFRIIVLLGSSIGLFGSSRWVRCHEYKRSETAARLARAQTNQPGEPADAATSFRPPECQALAVATMVSSEEYRGIQLSSSRIEDSAPNTGASPKRRGRKSKNTFQP